MKSDAHYCTCKAVRGTQKHQTGVEKQASGAAGTKQMLFLRLLPPPLQVPAKQGPVIWSVFCCSIQPWEVSKPSDLIRAVRVPGVEWRIDLPITRQNAFIKPWLLTWHKERREAVRKERHCVCTRLLKRLTRSPAILQIKNNRKLQRQDAFKAYKGTG